MKKVLQIGLILSVVIFLMGSRGMHEGTLEYEVSQDQIRERSVQSVLIELGEDAPMHYYDEIDHRKAEAGRMLVHEGMAPVEFGGTGKRISRHFVCTDCHNTVREHIDIAEDLPEDRLNYCMDNDIDYKPGSTFWGITNREQWYTNDYLKKYGDLAKDAQDTLANAVQLCAKECSSGRYLTDPELEAIMHYLQSLELTLGDLNLSEETYSRLSKIDNLDEGQKKELVRLLKSKYNLKCMATFADPIPKDARDLGENGDPAKGKFLYHKACMTCHAPNRVTQFEIIDDDVNKRYFAKKMRGSSQHSIYEIIRKGTHPVVGRMQYMPFYTLEKMTDEQIEDLAAYINQTK